ncbi:hypothetical protein HMI56_006986 [Coelomomyces lativittatus]|nr:hypothetical protein HMI56_006986 [Coelomomyces lativittatus]
MIANSIKSTVISSLPQLEDTLVQYISGIIQDSDFSDFADTQELVDFLSPLLLPPTRKFTKQEVQQLCSKLKPFLKNKPPLNGESSELALLENGPVHLSTLNPSLHATHQPHVDITHAGAKHVLTRVDEKKLEKAEWKLKQKMDKRKTAVEVSFKIIDQPTSTLLSDAQIVEILAARGKNNDILLENFDLSHAGLRILTNAKLSLNYARRYGLVGRNGIGKSTLLRALASREIPSMSKFKHVSIGFVEQELSGDAQSCIEHVLKGDVYREFLLREEKRLNQLLEGLADKDGEKSNTQVSSDSMESLETKLKNVLDKLEQIEASTAEARASVILSGLGFSKEMQLASTNSFSGGWKMRIALAKALFTRPDLLLLDEPTNHLDIPAVVWLSHYLVRWPSTLLVVSHDRTFLDAVVTDIMYMHDEKLDTCKGNFSVFEKARDERKKQAIREYETQMQYREHLQSFVDRWRYNAKRAAQAQSKIKILEKLPELEVPTEEIQVTFSFPNPEKISPPVLQLRDVSFGYTPDKIIVRDVNLDVQLTARVAVVGPNGAGKSTILKLLTGGLEPTRGEVFRHGRLRFAFFSQHHVDVLEDLNLTPVHFLAKHYPGHLDEEYRRQLGCFGISGRVGLQSLATLSGGQKSRVVFAALALQRPSILVLDEPTVLFFCFLRLLFLQFSMV